MYTSIVENTCFARGVNIGEEYYLNAISRKHHEEEQHKRVVHLSLPLVWSVWHQNIHIWRQCLYSGLYDISHISEDLDRILWGVQAP